MEITRRFKYPEENAIAEAFWLERLEARVFVSSQGQKLPYRLYVPDVWKPGVKLPFQLHLHGGGLRGDDNELQIRGDHLQTQMLTTYQEVEPFIFAIPQCPVTTMWSPGQKWDGTAWHMTYDLTEGPVVRALRELVAALQEEFGFDEEQMYLSGMSMGGSGSYELMARYPGLFKGAVLACASSDTSIAPALANTPIILFHGDQDEAIPVEDSRRMAKALIEAGAQEFEYHEMPGQPHALWSLTMLREDGNSGLTDAMNWVRAKVKAKLAAK